MLMCHKQRQKSMGQKDTLPIWGRFMLGGVAGCGATLLVQPIDLIKTRQQLAGRGGTQAPSLVATVRTIVQNEGALSLYNGLGAGLLRQGTYTTTRLGVFNVLMDKYKEDGSTPGFGTKLAMGCTAGITGSFVGNPAEISLIRMTADGSLPAAERRGYTSVFNALVRITTEEGVRTLWRGYSSTALRAMVVNATQLSTYAEAKERIKKMYGWDGVGLHFTASMLSGLATTIASMPVDIIKTRVQNMKPGECSGGPATIFANIVKHEGIFALWKGFVPYYTRLGTHTVVTFMIMEQLTGAFQRMYYS